MHLALIIIGIVLGCILLVSCIDVYMVGFASPKYMLKIYKKEYLIKKKVRIDFQGINECAGFSSAYLLRHLGIEVGGQEIYQKMPYKTKSGYVYPKSIPLVLSGYGIKARYYKGNFNTLRNVLTKGSPIILIAKRRLDKNWIGYITIVGYDENYVYLADSHEDTMNCSDNPYYNCKMEIEVFKKLWKINNPSMPFHNNTFIALI